MHQHEMQSYSLAKRRCDALGTGEDAQAQREAWLKAADATKEQMAARRQAKHETLPSTLKKLTSGYAAHTYWFEIFESVRKILIVGVPAFFEPGTPGQLILGLVLCFVTSCLYCAYAPYEDPENDLLAAMGADGDAGGYVACQRCGGVGDKSLR